MSLVLSRILVGSVGALVALATLAEETQRPGPRAARAGEVRHPAPTNSVPRPKPSEQLRQRVAELAPAPEGVQDLFFDEFFRNPVGPLGLELTDRLSSLQGKRIRILGFMVKQARSTPWTLLLAPFPLKTHEVDYDLADELPANTVRVFLPRSSQPITPHVPGLLLLTGRLEVGDREEADGRHSVVRLHLDAPPASPGTASTNSEALLAPLSTADSIRR